MAHSSAVAALPNSDLASEARGCPLCASHAKHPVCVKQRKQGSYRVVQCESCGFYYVNPEPSADELATLYDSEYSGHHDDVWHGFEDRLNESVIRTLRARGVTALVDLGAGQGRFVSMARKAGLAAEGVEPSGENCRAARERYGIDLRNESVQDFLLRAEDIGPCVTMLNVLEHIPDPVAVLGRLARKMNPGGTLLIIVPNVDFTLALGRIRRLLGMRDVYMLQSTRFSQQGFDPPIHLSSFDAQHLRAALEQAGFRVDEIGQAPVIGAARRIVAVIKHAIWLLGRVIQTATFGRVTWGYSLLAVASVPSRPATRADE